MSREIVNANVVKVVINGSENFTSIPTAVCKDSGCIIGWQDTKLSLLSNE